MSKPITEWDVASYNRKFGGTLAKIRVQGEERWEYISGIEENHIAYIGREAEPLYEVLLGKKHNKKYHSNPTVEFLYVPIRVGVYASKSSSDKAYYIFRRHKKSYKIGLSDESFFILTLNPKTHGYDRPHTDIDLDKPLHWSPMFSEYQVFSNKMVRVGTTLYADGEDIGFMQDKMCVLRHKFFEPFVKPRIGPAWQIES